MLDVACPIQGRLSSRLHDVIDVEPVRGNPGEGSQALPASAEGTSPPGKKFILSWKRPETWGLGAALEGR
jgi:hypothetical protein